MHLAGSSTARGLQPGSRAPLLGTALRPAAAARRCRGSGSLQVQALKIKWNQPADKPSSSKDEEDSKGKAAAEEEPAASKTSKPSEAPKAEAPAAAAAAAAAAPKVAAAKSAQTAEPPGAKLVGNRAAAVPKAVATAKPSSPTGGADANTSLAMPAPMGAEAKLAVAAKISAARMLARKLAEEKQAALAASRLASTKAVDPDSAKQ